MSAPLLWNGLAARFLRSQVIIPASTSGQLTLSPNPITASYSLVMPASQGGMSTVLTNDGAGNLSWAASGANTPTTFTLANGQTAFSDVTGFLVNPASNKSFSAEVYSVRSFTNALNPYVEDTAFYGNLGTGFNNIVYSSAVQANGQIVIGGLFTSFNGGSSASITRVNNDGTLDTTFATNVGTGFNAQVSIVAIDPNTQKIVIAGNFNTFNGVGGRGAIVRLNTDGTIDTAFETNIGPGSNGTINGMAIQANSQIVIMGTFTSFNGVTVPRGIIRLNSDGTTDTTFSTNVGVGFTSVTNAQSSVVIQPSDQKILIGGGFTSFHSTTVGNFFRLNTDGTFDSTFQTNIGTAFNSQVSSIVVQSSGQIVVGGGFSSFNGNSRDEIVRLNNNGTEDTAFQTTLGPAPIIGGSIFSMAIDSTDNIYIGGGFSSFNTFARPWLLALTASGQFRTQYSQFLQTGFNNTINALTVDPTGRLLVGGNFSQFNGLSRNSFDRLGSLGSIEYSAQNTIKGIYNSLAGSWTLSNTANVGSDNLGIELNMTNLGQMQYTTSNIIGTSVASTMKFLVTEI